MPPGGGNAMLLHHDYFPVTVLRILTGQRRERSSWAIPGTNRGCLPDCAASPYEPQVQFVVLISDENFVEESQLQQSRLPPASRGHRIHIAFVIRIVEACAAAAERRAISKRNCSLHRCIAYGERRAAYVIRFGLHQNSNTLPD